MIGGLFAEAVPPTLLDIGPAVLQGERDLGEAPGKLLPDIVLRFQVSPEIVGGLVMGVRDVAAARDAADAADVVELADREGKEDPRLLADVADAADVGDGPSGISVLRAILPDLLVQARPAEAVMARGR